MLEASEAVAASLDLFDAQVEAFGGSVRGTGVVVGEDLWPPFRERRSERHDLCDVVFAASGDDLGATGACQGFGARAGYLLCMSASREGSLIQATAGSLGGVGRRCRNRSGLTA